MSISERWCRRRTAVVRLVGMSVRIQESDLVFRQQAVFKALGPDDPTAVVVSAGTWPPTLPRWPTERGWPCWPSSKKPNNNNMLKPLTLGRWPTLSLRGVGRLLGWQ